MVASESGQASAMPPAYLDLAKWPPLRICILAGCPKTLGFM